MSRRKGIVLAGGDGKRLYPITVGTSKQLLSVYDKPMIYYPISTLMLAGIKEIAIISKPEFIEQFKMLLGVGSQWGVEFTYILQPEPKGLAEAFILAEDFLDGLSSAMILGDNIFHGANFRNLSAQALEITEGAAVFSSRVFNPNRYGVPKLDKRGKITEITEKPINPASNFAITGLYFLDSSAPDRAKDQKPSIRGELEIVDLLQTYLSENRLKNFIMRPEDAWFDVGTTDSLLDAGNFVKALQKRQNCLIGSPDEIALDSGWIDCSKLKENADLHAKSDYGLYLNKLI